MKGILVAIGIVILAVTAGTARAAQKKPPLKPEYAGSQIKTMTRKAHTVEQYTVLAIKSMILAALFAIGASSLLVAQPASKEGIRRMFLNARAPDLPPRYSRSEIRNMIHAAKTPDDFYRLADYFDFRAMEFEQKSEEQLKELQRLLALPYHVRGYATQVDNARELRKRYKAQARECSVRVAAYRAQIAVSTEILRPASLEAAPDLTCKADWASRYSLRLHSSGFYFANAREQVAKANPRTAASSMEPQPEDSR